VKAGRVQVVAKPLSWPTIASLAVELLVVEEVRGWSARKPLRKVDLKVGLYGGAESR
jgi:hypothetical protein